MKIKSPIVTLLVGVLIAVIVTILSVQAHDAEQKSAPARAAAVIR
jgi:hypothetical protein